MDILDAFFARIRIKKRFKRRLGYKLNLRKPQSYCEKIQWLKLNHNPYDSTLIERADKYLVRRYLENIGFGNHLVKLHGVWDTPEDIDWINLPRRFVLKLNNGSGPKARWFVKDKSKFSVAKFEAEAKEKILKGHGHRNGEFHYGKTPTKIIAEDYLEENGGSVKDYKFYCFHGCVLFLSVEEGKIEGHHVREYYNTRWERHPVGFFNDVDPPRIPFEKPENFQRMIHMSETLSAGYPHVRVDLYSINDSVFFGELTYTPEAGFTKWEPRSLDFEYGKLMDIYNINH